MAPRMARATVTRVAHFLREFNRVKWVLIAALAVLYMRRYGWLSNTDPVTVAVARLVPACLGAVLAHVFRQQAFPYIDLGEMYRRNDPKFGSAAIMVGLIYLAFILAVAMSFG